MNPPAPGYKYVRVSDFAVFDDSGKLARLCCKLCGTVVAEKVSKVISRRIQDDGRVIEQVETRLRYNSMYAEMVIDMETEKGIVEQHATTGCKKCFAGKLKPAILHELVRCDMEEQAFPDTHMERHAKRTVTGAKNLDTSRIGAAQ
jgi:hypothetical protein